MTFEWDIYEQGIQVIKMREEYDIKNLNPRKNPYAKLVKKQITILEISRNQIRYTIKKLQMGNFD